jgi:hypothetical protein
VTVGSCDMDGIKFVRTLYPHGGAQLVRVGGVMSVLGGKRTLANANGQMLDGLSMTSRDQPEHDVGSAVEVLAGTI